MATSQAIPSGGPPLVYVTDDDASMREALRDLFESLGMAVEAFATPAEMLAAAGTGRANCLVLDIRMPGLSGLEVQQRLARAEVAVPVIFMTGHADIPMTVRAMKAGAFDFLTKPFRDQDMIEAVNAAIACDRERRAGVAQAASVQARFATLTPREREVMELVASGLMNKQVAGKLGLSEVTVKLHRGQAMRKMGAASLADLVRMAEALSRHAPRA